MLRGSDCKAGRNYRNYLIVLLVMLCVHSARTQDAVSVLRAKIDADRIVNADNPTTLGQPFMLIRNLIFFTAQVNGQPGNFVLDTGAPSLLLNNRGNVLQGGQQLTGVGAGGDVALSNQLVESFEIGSRNLGKYWALTLDLRNMEQRTGQTIDGYVGQELLFNREVRINYPARSFQLRKSERHPLFEGTAPRKVLNLEFVDHLPVITLKMGNRKLRFAIDTGAGVNVIDENAEDLFVATEQRMDIQGFGGNNTVNQVVTVPGLNILETGDQADVSFVSMDLAPLQSPTGTPITGILGSAFLFNYVVGIDYRRRKLYFW